MNSTTLLGLVGVGGTLLGTIVGAVGALGAARINSRTQVATEEQRARRQAYSACATALLARRDAAFALVEGIKEEGADLVEVQNRLRAVDEQRDAIARAIGVVLVEGPYNVASAASRTAQDIEELFLRLRDWASEVALRRPREELHRSHFLAVRQDMQEVETSLHRFTEECRYTLRPHEYRARWFGRARPAPMRADLDLPGTAG